MRRAAICLSLLVVGLWANAFSQIQPSDSLMNAIAEASAGEDHRQVLAEFIAAHPDNGRPSQSIGTVGKGSLSNGKLVPFSGTNFRYYDTISYLDGRAFVHGKVLQAVLGSYAAMDSIQSGRMFTIMECSKQQGGKIWPHRTHQNGMSIDFMVPMSQDGQPWYGIDNMGMPHYLLDFTAEGGLAEYPGATIDFEAMAQHLLALNQAAKKAGLRITKVLLRGNLHDELFASVSGQKLKSAKIYFPTELEPLIDGLHDNHYHVDFAPL
ncbi:MAG: hypothetical protein U0176_20905 [Bacteroidia bacterium]